MHDAVKYSLGSRTSMEPVWRLIKACNWNLINIIQGLEQMDFGSNVRDNSLLKAHTELSARKYFTRERHVVSPASIGLLEPLMAHPDIWDAIAINRMLSNLQFSDLRSEQHLLPGKNHLRGGGSPNLNEIKLLLLDPVEQIIGQMNEDRLHIFRGKQPFISLQPRLSWPKPRLKKSAGRN